MSLRKVAWISFAIAVLLLLVIGAATYRTVHQLVESEHMVSHTHQVQTQLEDLRSDLLAAGNARRGYVITKDEALLGPFKTALQEVPKEMQRVRDLTSDNSRRRGEFDRLQTLIGRNLRLMNDSITAVKQRPQDYATQVEITRQTYELGTQIHQMSQAIRDDESRLLSERRAESQRAYRRASVLITVGFIVVLCLFAAEFYLLNLEFSRHQQTERVAHRHREALNAFFSSSTVGFAILNSQLRYETINRELAEMAGLQPANFIGRTLSEVFGDRGLEGEATVQQVMRTGEAVLGRERSGEFPARAGEVRHWLVNYFPIRDEHNQVSQIGIIALDVTARRTAEDALRRLSSRLINVQDEERRRIAREIHDGLGQYLAGLKITVELIASSAAGNRGELLSECSQILEQCISETRTLSYLLHPPLLDEAGFASAASWFVNGFSQRSGIRVNLDFPANLSRMPNAVETALFRIMQEALTNVHRHSRSQSADICLKKENGSVILEIRDHGQGIPSYTLQQFRRDGTQSGVGLAGMRERIYELGGTFDIESDSRGTRIEAHIPLKQFGGQSTPAAV